MYMSYDITCNFVMLVLFRSRTVFLPTSVLQLFWQIFMKMFTLKWLIDNSASDLCNLHIYKLINLSLKNLNVFRVFKNILRTPHSVW